MNARPVLAAALFLSVTGPVFSASAEFYPLAQRWAKSRTETVEKSDAATGSFRNAASRSDTALSADPFGEPPSTIKRALSGLNSNGESLELESSQILILTSDSPVSKFASTEEPILSLQLEDSSTLVVTALEIGKTIVHVWNAAGRKTFEVRVIPRKIIGPTYLDARRDEIQKTRPFKFRFTADGGTYETGDKFTEMRRTSLDHSETASIEGDTPYGYLQSHASVQRSGLSTKNLLSDAQVSLKDGRVGPFRNFNATGGDATVRPDFLVFSRGRVRGAAGETWTDDKRFNLEGFFGREQQGIFAPLSTSATSRKRTIDSFLSGTTATYRPKEDTKVRAGYFTGYGHSRPDELNRESMALSAETTAGPHLILMPEVDFDSEHVAHLHVVRWKNEKGELRSEFRNISEDFQSMLGAPSQQGELGGRWDATVRPWERWTWRGMLDVFKDRRIPNPDALGERNIHAESDITYEVGDTSSLQFTWRDWDDTGRLSPSRDRTYGLQYTESFDAFNRAIGLNIRASNRQSRFLSQSFSDYDRDEFVVGVYFPIFWNIRFSIQKEWFWLDNLQQDDGESRPESLAISLGYSHRLWESPFYVDLNYRWRDEEETEARNSFMSGEDTSEISGGLYYRETEDLELYLKGQFQSFNAESLLLTGHRVEGQVMAGMRWDWDTGIRWGGAGHVKGYIFKDENRNGLRDAGEPGMPGIQVETIAGHRAISNPDGAFEIRGITDRSASISIDATHLPPGYVATTSVVHETEIRPGKEVEIHFGFAPSSDVTGVIFNDLNANGKLDSSEPGVGRVRVKLDGKPASSSGAGAYSFRSLSAGPHKLELDLLSVAEGYLPSETTRKEFELTEGMHYEWNVPLRAYRVVSGRVFRDKDGNGAYSLPEDEPIANAKVFLASFEQLTDTQGRFLFDQLPSGEYELSLDSVILREGEKAPERKTMRLTNEPITHADVELAVSLAGAKVPTAFVRRTASESAAGDVQPQEEQLKGQSE